MSKWAIYRVLYVELSTRHVHALHPLIPYTLLLHSSCGQSAAFVVLHRPCPVIATSICTCHMVCVLHEGLTGASIPVFLPGSLRFIPLTPELNPEDKKVMDNVKKLGNFLTGGDAAGLIGGSSDPTVVREITPFLPSVATEIAPEVFKRLASRLSARAVRELFVSSPP